MSNDKNLQNELKSVENDINQIDRAIDKLSNKKQKLLSRKKIILQRILEDASEKLANQDWERSDHSWSNRVNETLRNVFKMNRFRPHQLSTINAVLSGQDCILLMPTGGGKSLCYQLPAMVLDGITLVVSPLVSLMEDQIMAMESLDVPAVLLNANSTREHVNHVHKQMTEKNSSIKLLYVTPEKLAKSKRFMAKLEKMYKMGLFSLLAIDEVHCCSQWGHDFRTDYKFLGIMKRQFPKVPILGLTATATSSVIADVQKMLNIPGCLVLKASFNRPNLKYEVVCKSSCQKDNVTELEDMLKNRFNGVSGIIYCFSIKDSEEIASELRKRGVRARAYHAQLDAKSRSSVHKSWASNSIQVIVATVAFGMGIDKPDVRFVIHHSMPKSMENFYQESGRAGRDEQPASCILFFRFPDVFRQSTMVFTDQKGLEHLYAMVGYCLDLSRCRRAIIAQHFGERWNSADCNNMCDHCDKFSPYVETTKNVTREYRTICRIIEHCNTLEERLTNQKLIDLWLGKGAVKHRPPDYKSTTLSRENCERIIALLLVESYLVEEFHFTPYSTISYINIGSRLLPPDKELNLPMPALRARIEKNISASSETTTASSSNNKMNSTPFIQKKTNKYDPSLMSQQLSEKKSNISKTETSPDKTGQSSLPKKKFDLCMVNDKKSHFQNGVVSSPNTNKISTKKRKVPDVLLSDSDEEVDKRTTDKLTQRTTDKLTQDDSEIDLVFDDYDIVSAKKKIAGNRDVPKTVIVSDSD